MIFYKPITEIELVKAEFPDFSYNQALFGCYVGYDENKCPVGKCLMSIDGYNCNIHCLECDYSDKLLVEGFLRAALNFCANKGAYMAYCSLLEISDVLEHLGFENINGAFSGDIPTLLKGSCCK